MILLESYNKKKIYNKIVSIFVAISMIAVFLALVYRMFFGLDWSDEGYYATSAYRFVLGDKMFVDTWDIHQTSSILVSPIIYLFMKFTNSINGIILFLRAVYLFFKICLAVFVYFSVKKAVNSSLGYIAANIVLVFTPFGEGTLSYNTLGLMFNLYTICSIFNILYSKNKKERLIYSFLAGVFLSFCVISYPTYLICVPIYFVLIIYIESILGEINKNRIQILTSFIIGMFAVGIIFVIYIQISVGFSQVINNIAYLFGEEDHVKQNLLAQIINYIKELNTYIPYKRTLIIVYLLLLSFEYFVKKSFAKYCGLIYLILVILLSAVQYFTSSPSSYKSHIFLLGIGAGTFLMLFLVRERDVVPAVIIWWVPSFFGSIAIFLGTNNGLRGGAFSFVGSAIAALLLIFSISNKYHNFNKTTSFIGMLLGIFIILILLYSNFNYVYRDSNISNLKSTLRVGPYSLINTTKEKAAVYEELYYDLKDATLNQEYAAIVQCLPYAYMCIDSKIASHTVWWIHADSNRFNIYLKNNESHKPSVVILLNEDIGFHNEILNSKDSYLMDYIKENMTTVKEYKHFKAYYLR